MPATPASPFQLLEILIFLLPGFVFQFTRGRLRGPSPDDASSTNRLLRALTVSTLLAIAYALILGRTLTSVIQTAVPVATGRAGSIFELALWALVLLFLIPFSLAVIDHLVHPRLARFRFGTYDPTPSAWDFTFKELQPCYLRILLNDGRYVGGWYGADSFVSSYPEPHDLFMEKAHRIAADGTLGDEVEGSAGVWVPCDRITLLEVLAPTGDQPELAEPLDSSRPDADRGRSSARSSLAASGLVAGGLLIVLRELLGGRHAR